MLLLQPSSQAQDASVTAEKVGIVDSAVSLRRLLVGLSTSTSGLQGFGFRVQGFGFRVSVHPPLGKLRGLRSRSVTARRGLGFRGFRAYRGI